MAWHGMGYTQCMVMQVHPALYPSVAFHLFSKNHNIDRHTLDTIHTLNDSYEFDRSALPIFTLAVRRMHAEVQTPCEATSTREAPHDLQLSS
jgi:hypothetical protein